ncbi:hypothetical protein KDA14_04985, partial [Candidatus Saccharibacteria bacterium]|nr:hypothetical protein [Candidatus Saccharibacteria bacterium]
MSDFRAKGLLKELNAAGVQASSISAEYIHFVDTDKKLSPQETKELEKLLTYDTPYEGGRKGTFYLVVPRPGTISPWSSKATDIAHNAGLMHIKRIERGTAYYIDSDARELIRPV